jgi:hypothetical protein
MDVSPDDIHLLGHDLASAGLTAWSVEWAQRHGEQWAYMCDKDL